jgi:hypothetical protein
MVKGRRVALAATVFLLGTPLACSALWGFDDLTALPPDASTDARADSPKTDAPSVDADAAIDAPRGDGSEASCVPALPPNPPAKDDDGGSDADLIFALRTIDLGPKLTDPIGFDLDTVCTCPGPSSCTLPSSATDGQACDHPGGRDNAAGALFAALGVFDPHLGQASLNDEINDGKFTFLVRIRGYNGSLNDTNVIVEFFNSPGSEGTPDWLGGDSWSIYGDNVVSGTVEANYVGKYIDLHAYVSNGTLVGHPSPLELRISPETGANDNYLQLPINDPVLTLQLADGTGTFAARMASSDLLKSVQVLENDAGFLCGTNPLYEGLAVELCPAQDIMGSSKEDNGGKACDAVSLGIAFTTSAAHLGSRSTPFQLEASCPPGWNPVCDL